MPLMPVRRTRLLRRRRTSAAHELRPFQREDVDAIKKSGLCALVASSQGTGKTPVAITALLETAKKSLPAVVICPASVTRNWRREFKRWAPGIEVILVEGTTSPIPHRDVHKGVVFIVNWALLDSRWEELTRIGLKAVVADECFPGNTKVSTPDGYRRIDEMMPGDEVLSQDTGTGKIVIRKVVRVLRKILRSKLVTIRHSYGSLVCTDAHDIWVEGVGFVEARKLVAGFDQLRVVREGNDQVLVEQGEAVTSNVDEQPDVGSANQRKAIKNSQNDQDSETRCRQRPRTTVSRVKGVEIFEFERKNEAGRSGKENSRRTESASFVYDLEVEDTHTYFAENVLVSNCHYVLNEDALRSQALYELSLHVAHRVLLLSGTPVVNTASDLSILYRYLGTNNPLMIRRLLEDVAPDIPPKKRSYVPIQLRPHHQEEYDRVNDDFENWLRSEKAERLGKGLTESEIARTLAVEGLAKINYLRQLVGEFKIPAASDWIARAVRLGEPVVALLEHQNVLRKLSKALHKQRIRHVIIEGDTPPKERQAAVDAFQRNDVPVFIGTKAAIEGITLTAARHLLYVQRFYTSAAEEQGEDRVRRIGQVHPTMMWYLHAVGTVDDRLDELVRGKRRIVRDAIDSADIAETETSNIAALLSSWGKHIGIDEPPLALGLGEPLPPLPSPADTHAIVFKGERWTSKSGARWCRMNGYEVMQKPVVMADRVKMVVHPTKAFKPSSFEIFPVSRDIKLIVGKRRR